MLRQIVCGLCITTGAMGVQLPALTGRYPVGTVSLELTDTSRHDSSAPTQPRQIMVSVFYPTTAAAAQSGNYSVASYFPSAKTAAAFDTYLGNSTEILKITTQSYHKAPVTNIGDFPVLIFSHGLGSSRFMYTADLENLASRGWIIIAPDHPYDALITEFPDGRTVEMPPSALDDFPHELPSLVEVRVADLDFIARVLQNATVPMEIPELGRTTINASQIGIFGHSLGGNTAAQAVANSSTFPCGANFDGGIFGPVAKTGLDKPFLQIGAEDHNQTSDATFAAFWDTLRGFRRRFTVGGTVHISFMDVPLLRDVLGAEFPAQQRNQSGTIAGKRLLEIEATIIDAFFSFCLKGASSDGLDHLVQGTFPDVTMP